MNEGHVGNPAGIGGLQHRPADSRTGSERSAQIRHRSATWRAVEATVEALGDRLQADDIARFELAQLYRRGYNACASATSQRRRRAAETPGDATRPDA